MWGRIGHTAKAWSVLPGKVRDGLTKEVTFELNLNDCQVLKGYVGASQAGQKPSSFRQ